ncbi:DUF4181 domain-containing protein [Rossellomorea sp. AcN35-11]|nr:DUF4181 domain-containing protein [Rossellomorea aquimaris]WJV29794.1 DUF4181 domain-containing protein [Rossellomorea sp. AcN35-11]
MFWVQFCLIATLVFFLISAVKRLLRKMFKIKKVKRAFFSYNHVNESHRKVDMRIRFLSAITLTILAVLALHSEHLINLYWMGVALLVTADYAVRAFFELKHSEYPKQAVLTIAEMFIMLTAILLAFQYLIT